MGGYVIVSCPKCGEYRIVRQQKTYKCFSCGGTSLLRQEHIIEIMDSAVQARERLAYLKSLRRKKHAGPVKSLNGAL